MSPHGAIRCESCGSVACRCTTQSIGVPSYIGSPEPRRDTEPRSIYELFIIDDPDSSLPGVAGDPPAKTRTTGQGPVSDRSGSAFAPATASVGPTRVEGSAFRRAEPSPSLICSATQGSCSCSLASHEDGPHACKCGGSWEWRDGRFFIYALPGTSSEWVNPSPGFTVTETRRYWVRCQSCLWGYEYDDLANAERIGRQHVRVRHEGES